MTIQELRASTRAAFERLERANQAIESLSDDTTDEQRTAAEAEFEAAETEHRGLSDRLVRAEAVEVARKAAPVQPIADTIKPDTRSDVSVTDEPPVYAKHSPHSFFRDIARQQVDSGARERLERHEREMQKHIPAESRALSSTDSAGGYLVAPLWLQDEFVTLARAGRAVANAIGTRALPPNTDSINLPTMATGTAVGTQTDNGAVTSTDATFGTVAADVKTVAGMQDVAQQLVDRGVPGIDTVIFGDLVRAYNVLLDQQVINSSTSNNKGLLNVTGVNAITYTDASPTLPELYSKLADGIRQIQEGIFMAPDAIFMHPRRWAWCLASLDTSNRPLVVPVAQGPFNAAGQLEGLNPQGPVGSIMGLPVFTDANIPSTLGAGTNEDRIIIAHRPDLYIWEDASGPFLDTFRDVGSGTLTVRFRAFNYWAQCHERRPKAISVVSGTGLVAPTF